MNTVQSAWDDIVRLAEQSTLVSGAIALIMVGTACYLWATGQQVPDPLMAVLTVVVGFFFGAKTQKTIQAKQGGGRWLHIE